MTDPMTTPPLDLPALRKHARDLLNGENVNEIEPDDVLALIDRVGHLEMKRKKYNAAIDRAEAAELWTVAHPCQVSHEQPYDFKWCETHDRTFPLDGDCDHKGKSALQWQDGREQEQRARALRAEGRAEAAEAAVAAVREALEAHPKACDRHTEDDPIKCGWKRAVADVSHALDGTA